MKVAICQRVSGDCKQTNFTGDGQTMKGKGRVIKLNLSTLECG